MEAIQEVLKKNHKSRTKKELVEMMKDLRELITPKEYEKIIDLDPDNLTQNTKEEILDVIEDFQKKYDPAWEKNAKNKPELLSQLVKNFNITLDTAEFWALNAADAKFAAELASIDFDKLIGGPLNACVTAQANASLSTVNFIREVGFEEIDGKTEVRMVDFSHFKEKDNPYFKKTRGVDGVPDDANVTDERIKERAVVKVPFVSILNIPSLRIETCDIDFNVKLNSVYTKNVSDEFKFGAGADGFYGPVKFKVSVSYKRSSSTGIRVEKEYSMGVKVRATNDEMPAGLEKVLGILAE